MMGLPIISLRIVLFVISIVRVRRFQIVPELRLSRSLGFMLPRTFIRMIDIFIDHDTENYDIKFKVLVTEGSADLNIAPTLIQFIFFYCLYVTVIIISRKDFEPIHS